jgi:hypothetical protein
VGWLRGIAVAALLVLAGCGSGDDGGPLPKVEHPKAAVPKDRDGQAVLAALRRIDPCALLDPKGFPADRKPKASGPFTCSISRTDDRYADSQTVRFTTLGDQDRARNPLQIIGGAKAYSAINRDPCVYSFPVSFELAIEFSSYSSHRDNCTSAKELAQGVAMKLANPDAVAVAQSWDACAVLRTATNGESGTYRYGDGTGFDDCRASAPFAALVLGYSPKSDQGATVETIGGKRVAIHQGDQCEITWHNGVARQSNELWVSIQGVDCAKAKTMAERAMTALAAPPPETTPQRPLLYGPDDPDRPIPGACVLWEKPDQCQPYVEVPVPSEKGQLIRAAEADPNVDCAMAIEAVTKHFGAQWKPVTITDQRGCTFIESTRLARVSVSTSAEPVSKRPHVDGERDLTIADHPGTLWSSDNVCVIDLATGKSKDTDGALSVTMRDSSAANSQDKPDEAKVRALATDLIVKHFS